MFVDARAFVNIHIIFYFDFVSSCCYVDVYMYVVLLLLCFELFPLWHNLLLVAALCLYSPFFAFELRLNFFVYISVSYTIFRGSCSFRKTLHTMWKAREEVRQSNLYIRFFLFLLLVQLNWTDPNLIIFFRLGLFITWVHSHSDNNEHKHVHR